MAPGIIPIRTVDRSPSQLDWVRTRFRSFHFRLCSFAAPVMKDFAQQLRRFSIPEKGTKMYPPLGQKVEPLGTRDAPRAHPSLLSRSVFQNWVVRATRRPEARDEFYHSVVRDGDERRHRLLSRPAPFVGLSPTSGSGRALPPIRLGSTHAHSSGIANRTEVPAN